MAVGNSVDPSGWFTEQIGAFEPDLLRYGERSEERVNLAA
jgi:hypothetical protein